MDVVRNQDERRRGYYFFVILDKVGWPGVKSEYGAYLMNSRTINYILKTYNTG